MGFTKRERDIVLLGILAMIAVGCLSMVAGQNWDSRVTGFPTKTETDINNHAQQILGKMTMQQKIGQLFMVVCPDEDAETMAKEYGFGGYILDEEWFAEKSKEKVESEIKVYQEKAEIPMFIGVHEEGGEVVPVSGNPNLRALAFLSPSELYITGGLNLVQSDAAEKSVLLKELGINMNFAPICDVCTEADAYMYDRAVAKDENVTFRYVDKVVSEMGRHEMIAVLNSFPGYGNMKSPTGTDDRSFQQLQSVDFLPIKSGISAGAPMVMVGHNTVTAIDDRNPASLSKSVHKMLRRDLGFEGVIITENLSALGADSSYAVSAIKAGNDMIYVHDPEPYIKAVSDAVRSGEISQERINESVLNVLKLKIVYGLL